MIHSEPTHTLPMKLVYLAIAAICIMIGIAGLIIPIIPGVLFLFLAVFMLGRVSRRFKRWSEAHPVFESVQNQFHKLGQVDMVSRAKVLALMSVNMMVTSLAVVTRSVRRLIVRK